MKCTRSNSRRLLGALLLLAGAAAPANAAASGHACDELWLISTRHIAEVPCEALPSHLEVHRRSDGCWRRGHLDRLTATHDPSRLTLVYIHGNRYTPEDALERGWLIYNYLRQAHEPRAPLRFVIWSWPSQRVPGLINDVRTKAERTDLEGLYLGTVLSRLPPDARISLLGYSYGARIISGALHLLAGGRLEGRALPPEYVMARAPLRAVMLAPAFQNTWLLPGAFHGLALTQVERLLVLYNSRDPVLRRYRLISPITDPQAAGYTGLVGLERLGPLAMRVEQWDLAAEIGRRHKEVEYLDSSFFPWVREYLLWRTPR